MKKCLLLLTMAFIATTASAQFTVWEDDFNDEEASDWNLLNLDGNASNWVARTNLNVDENFVVIEGSRDILGSYNIDLVTLEALGSPENNWAISPLIDLSYYGGPISLVLNAQGAIFDGSNELQVYASTTPEQESFTQIGTITLSRQTDTSDEFSDYSVDMSQFSGQAEVYFALVTNIQSFIGIEINTARIDAQSILSVKDTEGTKPTTIKQNPVTENLQLQLGTAVNAAELELQVYNVNGMLIKETSYSEAGLPVDDLSSGMYFVVLTDGNATERLKFIKK